MTDNETTLRIENSRERLAGHVEEMALTLERVATDTRRLAALIRQEDVSDELRIWYADEAIHGLLGITSNVRTDLIISYSRRLAALTGTGIK